MSVDHLLAAAGLGLAIASAALPWHVWSNPDSYGHPRVQLERLDAVLNEDPGVAAFAPRREARVVTGSVAPVPKVGAPTIVFATATHALARLPGSPEITLLRPGSKLGDGDAVRAIELGDGRWTVLTAKGRRLSVSR